MSAGMQTLLAVPGKGAAFVRGFLESDSDKLRDRQDAGLAYVEELGGAISVSYISKMSKMMETAGVIKKMKRGRNWYVETNDSLVEKILDNAEYGTSVDAATLGVGDVLVRSQFADYLDRKGCVVTRSDERLPKEAFKLAMERFNKGELDMAFYKPNGTLVYEGKKPKVWKP